MFINTNPDGNKEIVEEIKGRMSDLKDKIKVMSDKKNQNQKLKKVLQRG